MWIPACTVYIVAGIALFGAALLTAPWHMLLALALILAGAAAATWALARYQPAARLLGVAPVRREPPRATASFAAATDPAPARSV